MVQPSSSCPSCAASASPSPTGSKGTSNCQNQVKGRGRLRIRQELQARGVAKSAIDRLLSALPSEDEASAIQKFLARKRVPEALDAAGRNRVFQQLLRKGFTADAISKALRHRE